MVAVNLHAGAHHLPDIGNISDLIISFAIHLFNLFSFDLRKRHNFILQQRKLKCNPKTKEGTEINPSRVWQDYENSDSAFDFVGTQAACADVNSFRGSVNDGLNTAHIGFPGSVGTSVRVGDLDSENNFFSADITFRHI